MNNTIDPFRPPKQTLDFEDCLAHFFNVKEAVVVSSGTAALHCALAALDIGPQDEVIVPSLSVVMSIMPVLYQNARPIFVDSAPNSIDFDYLDLEQKITPRVKAIIPVYMWGCSYDITRLLSFAKKHNIAVVEDACQAHGSLWNSRYLGTWGDLGCFSMKDGKLISTGEGGYILTNNSVLAEKCRLLRNHCTNISNPKLSFSQVAWNYRLTEFQSLVGCWQMKNFAEIVEYRRYQTEYILQKISGFHNINHYCYNKNEEPNLFSPVLLLPNNLNGRQISEDLSKIGVINSVGSFGLQPAQERLVFIKTINDIKNIYAEKKKMTFDSPNATNFLNHVLALTILPYYNQELLDNIIEKIKTYLNGR